MNDRLRPRHKRSHATLDELFQALGHPTRRRILAALVEVNRPGEELPARDFTRADVTERLHHVHLPKLDEAGFIEWDHNVQKIKRGTRFHEIAPLLELMIDHQQEIQLDWQEGGGSQTS